MQNAPPALKPLTVRVSQNLLRQSTRRVLMMVDHTLFLLEVKAAVMVIVV